MADSILARIPVVGGLGYIQAVRSLPMPFTATLSVEPENRYFRHAIAVVANGEKVGYVAPEIARRYFEPLRASGTSVACPGRHGSHSDHETSGVELLLDFSQLSVAPAE